MPTLQEWMTSRKLNDAAFAELHGDASPFAVAKWRKGQRVPRPDALKRIYDVTDGEVTANDFLRPDIFQPNEAV